MIHEAHPVCQPHTAVPGRCMTIAIIVMPERGGYYTTFSLGRGLRAHGRRVVYYGPQEIGEGY